jgi:hypothetical protein
MSSDDNEEEFPTARGLKKGGSGGRKTEENDEDLFDLGASPAKKGSGEGMTIVR